MPKKFKILSLILILSLSLSLCFACAGDSKEAAYDREYVREESTADTGAVDTKEFRDNFAEEEIYNPEAPQADSITGAEISDGRKIIYNYELNLETANADKILEQSRALLKRYDAYLESSEVSTYNTYDHDNLRVFYFVWKVKAADAAAFVEDLKELATLTNLSVFRDDLSREYYDTAARIENKKLEEQRLKELLEQAESIEDIMSIEARLSDLRYEIENLEGRNRQIDRDVEESTVRAHIREVSSAVSTGYKQERSFGERISDYFAISLRTLKEGGEGILYFLIVFGPWLILLAILVIVIILIIRKLVERGARRKRERAERSQVFQGTLVREEQQLKQNSSERDKPELKQ